MKVEENDKNDIKKGLDFIWKGILSNEIADFIIVTIDKKGECTRLGNTSSGNRGLALLSLIELARDKLKASLIEIERE